MTYFGDRRLVLAQDLFGKFKHVICGTPAMQFTYIMNQITSRYEQMDRQENEEAAMRGGAFVINEKGIERRLLAIHRRLFEKFAADDARMCSPAIVTARATMPIAAFAPVAVAGAGEPRRYCIDIQREREIDAQAKFDRETISTLHIVQLNPADYRRILAIATDLADKDPSLGLDLCMTSDKPYTRGTHIRVIIRYILLQYKNIAPTLPTTGTTHETRVEQRFGYIVGRATYEGIRAYGVANKYYPWGYGS